MLRVDRRAGGIGGGSGCNTMPPKPLKGDFLFPPPSSSDFCPCEGTRCSAGHSRRAGRLCCRRRAQHRTQKQLLPTLMCRRPLHSVVQAHPSMPDTRSSVFCSYSSHSNGCIGGMATTRRGGYRNRSIGIILREASWGFGTKKLDKKIIQFLSVALTCADLVCD